MKNYNRKNIHKYGSVYYYLDDEFHRTDGPAIEFFDGTKYWWQNGQLHRTDGPAKEYANGDKDWYYYGEFIDVRSQKEFEKHIKTLILK